MNQRERIIRLWFDMWLQKKDLGILKVWHKAAARADSIEEFEQAVGIELV